MYTSRRAVPHMLTAGRGSIINISSTAGVKRSKRFEKDVVDSYRFGYQASHLLKHGAGRIGTIKGLISQPLSRHQASVHELAEFTLNGAQRDLCSPSQLAQIERFADVTVEHRKQGSARATK